MCVSCVKRMSQAAVLQTPELVEGVVSMGGVRLVSASKSIRDAQQHCAKLYERWADEGCTAEDEVARSCLRRIGGFASELCTGTYTMTELAGEWPTQRDAVSASSVAGRVASLIAQNPRVDVTTIVAIAWTGGEVRIQSSTENTFIFVLGTSLRFPENRVPITRPEAADAARHMLSTANVAHPLIPSILLPRELSVSVARSHAGLRWALLKAHNKTSHSRDTQW